MGWSETRVDAARHGSEQRLRNPRSCQIASILSLSGACRGALVCRVLPHSAAPRIRRISLTAIGIDVSSDPRSPSHNPEVGGSNPPPAICGNPIAASRLGLAVFVRGGLEIPARGVSELAGACRCAGRASTVASGGVTSRDCRVERGAGSADRPDS